MSLYYDDETAVTGHIAILSRLLPDTKYYYSVVKNTDKKAPRANNADYFYTLAESKQEESKLTVILLGDPGTGVPPQRRLYQSYLNYRYQNGLNTDFVMLLGDNAYGDGEDEQYQKHFFDVYKTVFSSSPIWPTLGNHDLHSADAKSQIGPYFDIFTLPTEGEAGGQVSSTESYYSFTYEEVKTHFITINT